MLFVCCEWTVELIIPRKLITTVPRVCVRPSTGYIRLRNCPCKLLYSLAVNAYRCLCAIGRRCRTVKHACNAALTLWQTIMANGLTNAVRHEFVIIANDRQTFVSVRKHSRSFLWCFECYAGLTSGECMENGLTNAIRHQFAMIAKWSPGTQSDRQTFVDVRKHSQYFMWCCEY